MRGDTNTGQASVECVEPTIEIQNVLVTANIGHPLNLDEVIMRLDNAKYEPKRFPCVVARLTDPKSCILLFSSGKMVCTGTKSTPEAARGVRAAMAKLNAYGIEARGDPVPQVRNVVATADLHGSIHIEDAARSLPRSMYEPELFPGLIHRMLDPRAVMLLFSSGRVVCAGAASEGVARRAVFAARSILVERRLIEYERDAEPA